MRKPFTWDVTDEGCWECTSHARNRHGYPHVWRNGTGHNAMRVVYEEQIGPISVGLLVRHKCDNRACINPDHLELGTWADNSNDCKQRGRLNTPRGESRSDTKLTSKQVLEIRESTETQHALATQYGVNQSTISRIKRGLKRVHL